MVGGGLRHEALVVVRANLREDRRRHGLAGRRRRGVQPEPGRGVRRVLPRARRSRRSARRRAAGTSSSQSFYPDATALQLLQEDITSPWTGPTLRHVHGSFGFGTTRTIGVQTTLDGSFVARLHAPAKARFRLELYNGSTLVARGTTNVRFEVCGQRSLTLKVQRVSGRGSFTVDVSKP